MNRRTFLGLMGATVTFLVVAAPSCGGSTPGWQMGFTRGFN